MLNLVGAVMSVDSQRVIDRLKRSKKQWLREFDDKLSNCFKNPYSDDMAELLNDRESVCKNGKLYTNIQAQMR